MIKFGYRSVALTNITKECLKVGMDERHILNCLIEIDSYVRKFADQHDGEQRLINFIRYCKNQVSMTEPEKPPVGWFVTNTFCCRKCWSPAFSNGDYISVLPNFVFGSKEECVRFVKEIILPEIRLIENDLLDEG